MDEILDMLQKPLVMPIVATLAIGAIAYAFSRISPLACKLLVILAGVTVIAGGVIILQTPQADTFTWEWVNLSENIQLNVDLTWTTLGMVVLFGSAGFAILVSIYSFRALAGEYWEGKFYTYVIWSLAGACIVALAGNLLVLLVGWEIVTLMLYLLINQGRNDAKSGAAKTYGILGFADACLLLSIALLAAMEGGSANLSLTGPAVRVSSIGPLGYFVYVLILIAALAKAGAIPLHTWIPAAAKDAPTPVMALLPAAMDKLLGIYLLAVLTLRMFSPDWTMQVVLMVIGAVTILAAVLMAMVQHNLKKLLSFHAVSQVGYMVLGIGTGTTIGVIGGLFHMINHAIYKCNLFLMSGAVGRATGTDEIEDMGGLARMLPVTFICGLISAAAISGVPPFNGFVSKWLIYQGTLELANKPLAVTFLVVAIFGSALTLASFVKVMYSAFLSPAPKGAAYAGARVRESVLMAAPMVVLAAACVLFGLWPQLVINRILEPGIAGASTTGQAITSLEGSVRTGTIGLWNPTQATGLVLIGILLGLILIWISRVKVRVVRPFLAGEVPSPDDDRFRVPGTHFYETIQKMPLIGPLLAHGQRGAMDLYHWCGRYGQNIVNVLRAQHTGLISLYVAWCLIGFIVILVYLLLAMRI